MVTPQLLSFFTGGGFLDIGFELAGFEIAWTNESNPIFADMYEKGMTAWRESVKSVNPKAIISSRKSIVDLTPEEVAVEAFAGRRPPLFGMVGGPPCPDFSVGGRNGGFTGQHGKLSQVFVDLICRIRPDFFLMENVPGLFRIKKHRDFLDSIIRQLEDPSHGYVTSTRILSSLEMGVPQDRDRLFLVGFARRLVVSLTGKGLTAGDDNWFPWPTPRYPDAKRLPWPSKSPFGASPNRPEGIPIELTVYPLLRGEPRPESLPNGLEMFKAHSPKFWQILEGDDSGKSFKRLHRHRYSPTAWYGNNEVHLHPWEPRRLSVREALRIQTVPDTYVLPADYPLTAKFKLICNGVPCKLAEAVADSIKRFLSIGTIDTLVL